MLAADAAGPAFQRLAEANHIFLAGELIHLQVLFYDCYVSLPWEDKMRESHFISQGDFSLC